MDNISADQRSEVMSRVRAKDTKPEMIVRKTIYRLGYRYRLHASELPGKPDLVFHSRKKVIFINGCFWHRHENCSLARIPKTRTGFWLQKLEGNRLRDKENISKLEAAGWEVLTIWECELRDKSRLITKVKDFLGE